MSTDRLDSSSRAQASAASNAAEALRLLPRSRLARVAVWIVAGALGALVFGAWLRPNMVFDLADMVFCN